MLSSCIAYLFRIMPYIEPMGVFLRLQYCNWVWIQCFYVAAGQRTQGVCICIIYVAAMAAPRAQRGRTVLSTLSSSRGSTHLEYGSSPLSVGQETGKKLG